MSVAIAFFKLLEGVERILSHPKVLGAARKEGTVRMVARGFHAQDLEVSLELKKSGAR